MSQHKAPHRNWQPGPKYLNKYDDIEIPEPATLRDNYKNRLEPASTQAMTIDRHLSANDLKLKAPEILHLSKKPSGMKHTDPRMKLLKKPISREMIYSNGNTKGMLKIIFVALIQSMKTLGVYSTILMKKV